MKIIVWRPKHEDVYIDASDEAKAYLGLFERIKKAKYYQYGLSDIEKPLFLKASEGDAKAAHKLLRHRRSCEHEEWWLITPEKP